MDTNRRRQFGNSSGFTLIEITVVLAIAAVLTAITFGAYSDLNASQKKEACQANLQQIYHALRSYMVDYGGQPPRSQTESTNPGLGLWALYCYPIPGTGNQPNLAGSTYSGPPIETYLRKASLLHCPRDTAEADDTLLTNIGTANPFYISYQTVDPTDGTHTSTYEPIRSTSSSVFNQLITTSGCPPADSTIVTWCVYHRGGVAGRNYDNVLFFDGSVQYLQNLGSGLANWSQRQPTPPS